MAPRTKGSVETVLCSRMPESYNLEEKKKQYEKGERVVSLLHRLL